MIEDREKRLEEVKKGKYFNTILPTSPDMEWHFREYEPLRGADPERDDKWSDLHDCLMANIFHQLNKYAKDYHRPDSAVFGNPFEHVAVCGTVPERITSMALRAFEEWMDRHGYIKQGSNTAALRSALEVYANKESWRSAQDKYGHWNGDNFRDLFCPKGVNYYKRGDGFVTARDALAASPVKKDPLTILADKEAAKERVYEEYLRLPYEEHRENGTYKDAIDMAFEAGIAYHAKQSTEENEEEASK